MLGKLNKLITRSFFVLLSLTPLILYPFTSEIFEFNKMVFVYIMTTIITALWIVKMIIGRKIVFRRTPLDIPIIVFLLALTLSTITSIDIRTSLLGYYSRFHGGLLSYLSYALLYWAFVSNCKIRDTRYSILALLTSAILVSLYGILQRFGIDKDIWVQDVQNRVFSTLGQPNWLAAWVVALMPVAWALTLEQEGRRAGVRRLLFYSFTLLLFLVLLFTKSRSGLLGFIAADALFWILVYGKYGFKKIRNFIVIFHISFFIFAFIFGTPWTRGFLLPIFYDQSLTTSSAPALETGGTESGEIRKIVWKGALDIWLAYPLLGTGVETFAFSYYNFRPPEHNLVSEWEFLYNRAHNEYLNFAATTGTLGLVSYLVLIVSAIYQILNPKHEARNSKQSQNSNFQNFKHLNLFRDSDFGFRISLLAGYASILITNFFGFSVVTTALLTFLFPAFAVTLERESERVGDLKLKKLSGLQKILIFVFGSLALPLLYSISRYWYADYLYSKGKILNSASKPVEARKVLERALRFSTNEAIFWQELSRADSDIAILSFQSESEEVGQFINLAIRETEMAKRLSPGNLNIRRSEATMYIKFAEIDTNYLVNAASSLTDATTIAPTDAKLFYNLALTQARIGKTAEAIATLEKTVELKPNYKNARLALGILYLDIGEKQKAIDEFNYILTNIDPDDALTKSQLEELR